MFYLPNSKLYQSGVYPSKNKIQIANPLLLKIINMLYFDANKN